MFINTKINLLQWMHEALKKWERESQGSKSVLKADILEYLSFSYYSQVRTLFAKNITIILKGTFEFFGFRLKYK